MPGNMNLSVNGQSQVPPGFRFHPTEEELLNYYLRKKVKCEKIDLDVIRDVDLNKLEPWDIQEKCKIGSAPQSDWYLFSHKDKKYPSGTRTNRATTAGFWKATGRDKNIYSNLKRIGMRKTLVFYRGRAPHGRKLDWIMHEYRLDDNTHDSTNVSSFTGEAGTEEGWVVCRVFKKKNYHKSLDGGPHVPCTKIQRNDIVIDHTPMHVERSFSCKQENRKTQIIKTPTINPCEILPTISLVNNLSDWGAVDQFVASQLNGHNYYFDEQFSSYGESTIVNDQVHMENAHHSEIENHQVSSPGIDLWGFARTSATISSFSDPLCYLSV